MKKTYVMYFILGLFLIFLTGCNIRVLPPKVDELLPTAIVFEDSSNQRIYVGESISLVATTTPPTADQSIVWSSSNSQIASVNDQGVVTGLQVGLVNIIAKSGYAPTISRSVLVLVEEKPTALTINGRVEMYTDESAVLSVTPTPANADARVEWFVDDDAVAIISSNGTVTARTPGVVTIEAVSLADDAVRTTHQITVFERTLPPTSIQIIGKSTIRVGEVTGFSIVVTPQEAIRTVTWSTSDETIGSIDSNGIFMAHSVGTVTLQAISTENEVSDTLLITVEEAFEPTILTLEDLLIHVIDVANRSVVGVSNYQFSEENNRNERAGIGSGSVYKVWAELHDGTIVEDPNLIPLQNNVKKYVHYIMTNRHVIEDSNEVRIYIPADDEEYPATMIQYDDKVDLAVVYFEHHSYLPAMKIADSDLVKAGSFAIALGNPSGYHYSNTATFGMISHPKRYVSEDTDGDDINDWDGQYIQHQVPINPGNSGGPLINLKGEIIGMNTWKLASTTIEGMGFSIPSNVIADLLPFLEAGIRPERARLGITVIEVRALIANPNPEYTIPEEITSGMYITGVIDGGVASVGGIEAGDIMISFNGVYVRTSVELRGELGKIVVGSGTVIEVEIYRNGEIIVLELVF